MKDDTRKLLDKAGGWRSSVRLAGGPGTDSYAMPLDGYDTAARQLFVVLV